MSLANTIDKDKLPQHVAIIMDGNGRWAKRQGKRRIFGHENGVTAVKQIVEAAAETGIRNLTLYAFSTENWNRPKMEIQTLMKLLVSSLRKELKTLNDNNIRLNTIGNIKTLPKRVYKELEEVIEKTNQNTHMTLTLALSYGGREEIKNAVIQLCAKVKNNIISVENIDESVINQHLYTKNLPDVDLLIRT
ncbi:MAG: di-trans,poly-cis-decaprenylcistransferase, partial [Sinomicrobium sp.]|nr:di-trans,poly-cis-decaprenylcistransferase [Sinomicrobium sp.]